MTTNFKTLFLVMIVLLVITSCTKKSVDNDVPTNNEINKSLCFTAEEAGVTIEMTVEGELPSLNIEYSTNGSLWFAFYPDNTVITLDNVGDKVYFRGNNPNGFSRGEYQYIKFVINDRKVAANGNIMSLIDPSLESKTIPSDWCFYRLFRECKGLTKIPKLPATKLKSHCYSFMFYECENIETATELPADTLEEYCYNRMFASCYNLKYVPQLQARHLATGCYCSMFSYSSITTPPNLPATQMAPYCYSSMFAFCGHLKYAPELPAMVLADECYSEMFYLSGLDYAPEILPATTLASGCYFNMFTSTDITESPILPATIMYNSCYSGMFAGSKLKTAPELPAINLANGCYSGMFSCCDSLKEAPKLPATELRPSCYSHMFSSCTSLTVAPELKATQLKDYCYDNMFEGCQNLNVVKVYLDSWNFGSSSYATWNWLRLVSQTGTFICPNSLPQKFDEHHIPVGWNVETF